MKTVIKTAPASSAFDDLSFASRLNRLNLYRVKLSKGSSNFLKVSNPDFAIGIEDLEEETWDWTQN